MHADGVAVGRVPGKVQPRRALVARADAVFPVIGRDKVAAGIADIGNVQIADQLRHVAAHPVLVGGRVVGFIDAGVDRPAQMLQKGRIDPVVDLRDGEIPVGCDRCFHDGLPEGRVTSVISAFAIYIGNPGASRQAESCGPGQRAAHGHPHDDVLVVIAKAAAKDVDPAGMLGVLAHTDAQAGSTGARPASRSFSDTGEIFTPST